MKSLNEKSEIFTIVVTDSGLGGLSVAADLERQISARNHFGKIHIVFFNAHAASGFGYNSMTTPEKKAKVFDSALNAMMNLYNPDMILIACNTLSVVYEQTQFSKQGTIDVVGIIDLGVEMILEKIDANSNATVLLLGTPTTINSFSYQNRLVAKGINEKSIVGQSCLLLETAIQQDPGSDLVVKMITEFLEEAKAYALSNNQKIVAALCCTHYGYSEIIFHTVINRIFQKEYIIVNPNKKMVEFVVEKLSLRKSDFSETSVSIVSQVKLSMIEISSIANILRTISPITASSLENYTYNTSLFEFNME